MTVEGGVAPGDVLAGYRVVALVGRGGAGDVYRARDDRLDRDVALKVLTGPYLDAPLVQGRMLRESRLAASLDHPNVVPVYDAGEQDGHLFIAMRFVDGNDLAAELRRGPMDLDRACWVAAQTAAALDAAHEQGLVHRDVKPSNVLVDRRGHCYLTDFGLSAAADETSTPTEGALVGTVDYVAPEQVRGEHVDGRADVYSLGCMLYEMLTGEVPFRRPTDVATLFAHLQEDAQPPHRLRPDLPEALDEVLLRTLAKDPDDRPSTCAQLVTETRHALGLGQLPGGRRAGLVAAAALAALVLAVAAAAVMLRLWEVPTGNAGPDGTLVGLDAHRGLVVTEVSVPGHPSAVAATTGGIWMADFRDGALWRFQPHTGALQRIASPGEPRDLAALGEDVYVASDGPKTLSGNVSRHDAATGVREDAVELLACALGAGEGVVWAAGCPFVQRLSTDGGPLRETRRVFVPFADPLRATTARVQVRELAVGQGALWVLGDAVDRRLWRLDARTGEIEDTVALPFPPRSVTVAAGRVWVTDPLSDTVVPVDPDTGRVQAPVPVGRGAAGIVAAAGSLWVAGALDGTVTEIDAGTGTVRRTITVGGSPHELSALDGTVWVTTHDG